VVNRKVLWVEGPFLGQISLVCTGFPVFLPRLRGLTFGEPLSEDLTGSGISLLGGLLGFWCFWGIFPHPFFFPPFGSPFLNLLRPFFGGVFLPCVAVASQKKRFFFPPSGGFIWPRFSGFFHSYFFGAPLCGGCFYTLLGGCFTIRGFKKLWCAPLVGLTTLGF